MSIENATKINYILQNLPQGSVATSFWLFGQGVNAQLAARYEKSQWLRSIGHGAYIRNGDNIAWQGGVYALQSQLGIDVHVSGKTALELAGYGHFMPVSDHAPYLYLFSGLKKQKLPPWFLNYDWKSAVVYKQPKLFIENNLALTTHSFPNFQIKISSPERAIMELLYLVPLEQGIDEASLILEGMMTLRSDVIQNLLEKCTSFKVKRLFLALSEEYLNPLFTDLDISKINLGKGKINLIPGGSFNKKFNITLQKRQSIINE
jgi:hypothetical protein